MRPWGIWYDGGRDFCDGCHMGWLAFEGKHYRSYRADFDTEAEAEELAAKERGRDPTTTFTPWRFDAKPPPFSLTRPRA